DHHVILAFPTRRSSDLPYFGWHPYLGGLLCRMGSTVARGAGAGCRPDRPDRCMAAAGQALGPAVGGVSPCARRGGHVPFVHLHDTPLGVDREHGQENFHAALRFIGLAPTCGGAVGNNGFMQDPTAAQQEAVWFWLCDGHVDDPALRELAVERVQQLGDAAQRQGVQVSLEMYEDTYIGTADEAVAFITDVDHPAVGLNPDVGNLVRLHREVEPWAEIFEKVLPYANFWHIKNYTRDYDPRTGAYSSAPMPLKYGYINYRAVIRRALELGYAGPFCCEHYGSDSLGVIAENVHYIRQVL